MKSKFKSIQTFIGAKNFSLTQNFYRDLGFEEHVISEKLSHFTVSEDLAFYLQDYYVKIGSIIL